MNGVWRLFANVVQVTPVAEFNTYADSIAAARVYALTSRYPRTTMPPVPPTKDGEVASGHLGPYPDKLSRRLRVTLFPLGKFAFSLDHIIQTEIDSYFLKKLTTSHRHNNRTLAPPRHIQLHHKTSPRRRLPPSKLDKCLPNLHLQQNGIPPPRPHRRLNRPLPPRSPLYLVPPHPLPPCLRDNAFGTPGFESRD